MLISKKLKHEDCIKLLHLKNNNYGFLSFEIFDFFTKWIYKGYKSLTWKYRHEIIKLSCNKLLESGFAKMFMNRVYSMDFLRK